MSEQEVPDSSPAGAYLKDTEPAALELLGISAAIRGRMGVGVGTGSVLQDLDGWSLWQQFRDGCDRVFPHRGLCAAARAHHPAALPLGLWPGLLQDGAAVSRQAGRPRLPCPSPALLAEMRDLGVVCPCWFLPEAWGSSSCLLGLDMQNATSGGPGFWVFSLEARKVIAQPGPQRGPMTQMVLGRGLCPSPSRLGHCEPNAELKLLRFIGNLATRSVGTVTIIGRPVFIACLECWYQKDSQKFQKTSVWSSYLN